MISGAEGQKLCKHSERRHTWQEPKSGMTEAISSPDREAPCNLSERERNVYWDGNHGSIRCDRVKDAAIRNRAATIACLRDPAQFPRQRIQVCNLPLDICQMGRSDRIHLGAGACHV